jgi:hypothetical protein
MTEVLTEITNFFKVIYNSLSYTANNAKALIIMTTVSLLFFYPFMVVRHIKPKIQISIFIIMMILTYVYITYKEVVIKDSDSTTDYILKYIKKISNIIGFNIVIFLIGFSMYILIKRYFFGSKENIITDLLLSSMFYFSYNIARNYITILGNYKEEEQQKEQEN